mmetsp:Transcript_131260/g.379716  ORF Transcript_131260/g.379716 Transcript_131260/m.379716 type:complete len:102 (-) Transcript_131260:105-410(-)
MPSMKVRAKAAGAPTAATVAAAKRAHETTQDQHRRATGEFLAKVGNAELAQEQVRTIGRRQDYLTPRAIGAAVGFGMLFSAMYAGHAYYAVSRMGSEVMAL